MKRFYKLCAAVALLSFGMISGSILTRSASAADILTPTEDLLIEAELARTWTGFNAGLILGAGAAVADTSIGGVKFDGIGAEGLIAGGYAGFDFQFRDRFVVGFVGEAAWTNTESKISSGGLSIEAGPEWTADASIRAGVLITDVLIYGIGGYSYADYTAEFGGANASQDYNGWNVGGGLETFVSDRFTVGVEYRFRQYDGENWKTAGLINVEPSEHSGRLRAGFHF